MQRFINELDFTVFGVGFSVSLLAILVFFLSPSASAETMGQINEFLWTEYMWVYIGTMFLMVMFSLWLMIGPWGRIKLGKPDEDPEFGLLSYFAMMFSAGIAAGIVFWGPAEALKHYQTVPPLIGAKAQSASAAVGAIQYTLFHWGISYWVPYLIVAIPIAYYAFREDAPMRVSTLIAPFVGVDNLDGFLAKGIDILAVFATIGGIATTLGFVGKQFLTGLTYNFGISLGDTGTVLVITGLTVAFTASVALGVKKGIARISRFNMGVFAVLTVATFLLGPTNYIMNTGLQAMGNYFVGFLRMSLYTNATGSGEWVGNWTVFYWAWVFSWAPFGGLFVARISRGRTIRQVVATALVGSTAATTPWFLTMGGSAIFFERQNIAPMLEMVAEHGVAVSGFPLFSSLPVGGLLSAVFLFLVVTFFITSADSSTLALGMLTTGGKQHPSTVNRVIWGALMGGLASLLIVGGGIDALRSSAIITGFPFALISVIAIGGMAWEFHQVDPLLSGKHDSTVAERAGSSNRAGASVDDD
ncbi:BCCT, betaine/carnitine/choline family transporter [Halogranum amylolyticum]|uniref:BCCT, betaine/carnitine/choline family transporter n=1 Tax=Halogranum amylolyticum TaxID=660520 RepID=A0A1H8VF49_9EURY|nr:BCCT family transporter [Halogranum amylolyticum]SEP14011.1 BCCT, betaine/carnitine/choline family transporter [Halogranum amylolyticum]